MRTCGTRQAHSGVKTAMDWFQKAAAPPKTRARWLPSQPTGAPDARLSRVRTNGDQFFGTTRDQLGTNGEPRVRQARAQDNSSRRHGDASTLPAAAGWGEPRARAVRGGGDAIRRSSSLQRSGSATSTYIYTFGGPKWDTFSKIGRSYAANGPHHTQRVPATPASRYPPIAMGEGSVGLLGRYFWPLAGEGSGAINLQDAVGADRADETVTG